MLCYVDTENWNVILGQIFKTKKQDFLILFCFERVQSNDAVDAFQDDLHMVIRKLVSSMDAK